MKEKLNPLDIVPKAKDYIDLDNIQPPTKQQEKQFKKSYAYNKYVKKHVVARKKEKFKKLSAFFWDKGLLLFNTFLALIAAVSGIISLLLQLN